MDNIPDAYVVSEHEAQNLIDEFEQFKQMKIYRLLCEQAAANEEEAIEALIATNDPLVAEVHRTTIQRCRYFSQWALSLQESLLDSLTYTEPPE